MKKEEVKTDFNFSFSELEQLGDKADDLMGRDAAELTDYGVDPPYRAQVAAQTQALKDYSSDEELLGDVTEATEQKDELADALKVSIRGVMVRVKQLFKEGSATYNRFGTKGLDKLTDNNLVRCGRRVNRMATKYAGQLAGKGLTPAMIAALGAATLLLDDAIDTQDAAIRARNAATQERIEMANALYAIIVELFDFGKDHWYTRNEAKYNDYIIYDTVGGGASPPDPDPSSNTIEGTVPAGGTVNVASGLGAASVVSASNTGTVPFVVCFTGNAAESCAMGTTVQPNETATIGGPANPGSSGTGQYLNITNNDPMMEAAYSVTITG